MAVVWALLAVALGCAIVYRFCRLADVGPRWLEALLVSGAGAAAGIGLTSCLFFFCRLAAPSIPKLSLFIEVATLAWFAYDIVRRRGQRPAAGANAASPFTLWLIGALIAAAAIATGAMTEAWDANPQGGWDAWSIWNLRARFLAAGGDLAHRAWSPALSWMHPEYPLLVPAFVARCWTYAGTTSSAIPIATSYLFFIALIAIVTGGFAAWRSQTLGLLLGIVLLGTPTLLHEAVAQYADIPLACYFAGATLFALLERPVLAGLFAGLAAWTKDEGALFLVVFLAAIAALRRGQIWRAALGAAPAVAVTAVFKFALAPSAPAYLRQGSATIVKRAIDLDRIGQVLGAFGHEFASLGIGWYHPVLPVIALAVALRFRRDRPRDLLFAGLLPAAMLAGYFGVFLITPYDLKWQLQTSLYRLIVQIWPGLLLAVFAVLRTPESMGIEARAPQSKARKKAKARHA